MHYLWHKNIDNDAVNLLSNAFSVCVSLTLWSLIKTRAGNVVLWYGFLLLAAQVISSIVHELGHIIGCFLTGSRIKILKIWIIEFDFSNRKIILQPKAENYVRFSTKTDGMRLVIMALGAVANLIVGSIAFCLSNLELLSFLGIFALI